MKVTESPVSGQPVKDKQEGANHVARIHGVLARVFTANGYEAVLNRTPLSELLAKEERSLAAENTSEEEHEDFEQREMRLVILKRLLRYFFEDSPEPWKVLRRVFAVARAYDPSLIGHMNGTDVAVIFNQERATISALGKTMFGSFIERETGSKNTGITYEKSASSRPKYAEAAKGNQNRKGKKVARLARAAKSKP